MLRLVLGSLLMLLLGASSVQANEQASEPRLDEVQQRGAQVMPFDLDQTMHIFKKTHQGGVQEVVVKQASNIEQIERIRAHLSKIARQFAKGDFSDPASIHGEEMPGLVELRNAKPGAVNVEYEQLSDGARIRYTTDHPGLINAIHRWFDVQLRDHARHAVEGHSDDAIHRH